MTSHILPPYLEADLIEKSLAYLYPDEAIVVENFEIFPATTAGDNYISDVFRVSVQFRPSAKKQETQRTSLIVKSMPAAGFRKAIIEELAVYEKEREMFLEVIPELSRIANDEFFAATCYYATRAPERTIVFSDLKSSGYVMANRHAGLDFEHCALIMRKIGKFHAASIPYAARNLEKMDKFFNFSMINTTLEENSGFVGGIFENGLRTLITVAEESWTDFDPKILTKLKQLLPVYIAKLEACLGQKFDDGFKVINHGDLWCNNMLFKYNNMSNKLEDMVLVDFQLCFYSSPGVDLNFAISNCPNLETRSRTDELISIYHNSLSETLKSISYHSIPTMAEIKHEIKRMEFYALVLVVSFLPIVMMEKSENFEPSIDAMVDEDLAEKSRKIQYNGKQYQDIVRPMLKEFYDRKLLDV